MRGMTMRAAAAAMAVGTILGASPAAQAIHWYRGSGGGCTPADGALTDDPEGTEPNVAATVVLGHNVFAEGVSGFGVTELAEAPEVTVKVGESVRWTWNSAHCHSVTSRARGQGSAPLFDSGFHYPTTPPDSPNVSDQALAYPLLDEDPSLSYTRTFTTPGTYEYYCVHHASIGMVGVVTVTA